MTDTLTPHNPFLASLWIIPVAVLLIVGPTLAWVTYDKYQQTHEAEYRLLEAHAKYADVQIGGVLREASRLLDKIADERSASPAQRNDRKFAATLAQLRREHPELGILFVADDSGQVVAASDPALVGRDISRLESFTLHRDPARHAEMAISRPDKSLLEVTAVTLSQPIADARGQFAGVVGATIDYKFFIKALQPVNPGDSASVSVIVNRYGDLIYRRYEPEKFFGKNVAKTSQVLREHLGADLPVTRHLGPSAHDGKTRLFVTRRIDRTGLSAILSRGQEDVLANWWRNLVIHGLIFVFTAAVMLFLARVAQRRQRLLQASSAALREAKETAETANAAKSHFLAAASHDLRQPLHALALLVAVLKRRHSDESSMKIIKPIEESTQALKELLDALLDISKLDAGVVVPQKQAVSVDSLLGRLESEFAMQIDARHLRLRVRRTHNKAVYTDPTLLLEMLRNLVSNACRHTRRGGILLGCRMRGGLLAIQVWDTGNGIPEAELGKIFREYYQVGNPERDRHKGLGLGLSIVERLAKLLGHAVQVRSRLGKGSLFEITVPLSSAAPAQSQSPASAALAAPLDILVIDDDPLVLQGTAMHLEMHGYRPIVARSAGEALHRIAGRAPDLILADYRLQGTQTGIEAIEIVRTQLGLFVPGIVISGDTLPARLREAKAGGFELLHKPVAPERLDAEIKRVLAKRYPSSLSPKGNASPPESTCSMASTIAAAPIPLER